MPKPTTSAASLAAPGLAVIAALVLTGCGQVRPSDAVHGSAASAVRAGALLCADPAAVTRVRIVRTPSLSQLGQSKPLRREIPAITVRDPATARRLAMVICALPPLSHPVFQCPIDVGGGYVLEFRSGRRPIHAVTVQASGCETVTGSGAGGTKWVARTPKFWTTFARLTGIGAPAHSP